MGWVRSLAEARRDVMLRLVGIDYDAQVETEPLLGGGRPVDEHDDAARLVRCDRGVVGDGTRTRRGGLSAPAVGVDTNERHNGLIRTRPGRRGNTIGHAEMLSEKVCRGVVSSRIGWKSESTQRLQPVDAGH
jgi:hypothetical protein